MLSCQFCGKEYKNNNGLKNHEHYCRLNPNRKLTPYERGIDTFKSCRTSGGASLNRGSTIQTETYNRQCPHCKQWFRSNQMGGHIQFCSKRHNEDRFVISKNRDILDITVSELEEYKKTHECCEICGCTVDDIVTHHADRIISKSLCVDHDHETKKFRGLLCQLCNRQLGWYEKYCDSINKYLNKNNNKTK